MAQTIFERIIAGEVPCAKVYEDEHVFAFMDAGQVNPGHVVIASKRPYETILEADEKTASALMCAAVRIANAINKSFKPEGFTILQANKPAGWQTVPHLHLHVLPRHTDDGVNVTWPRKQPSLAELQKLAGEIVL